MGRVTRKESCQPLKLEKGNNALNPVDFEANVVRLQVEGTKINEGRLVSLTSELTDLFKRLYKVCCIYEDHMFLKGTVSQFYLVRRFMLSVIV